MPDNVYIAGHGNFDNYGSFAVPSNITLKFYVDHGVGFDDSFEFVVLKKHKLDELDLSSETSSDFKEHTIKPGESCYNYHVHHPAGLKLSVARSHATQMPASAQLPALQGEDYVYLAKGAEMALEDILKRLPTQELTVHCLFCRSLGAPDEDWKGMMGGWEKKPKLLSGGAQINKMSIKTVSDAIQ
jgi:hypothetical protein